MTQTFTNALVDADVCWEDANGYIRHGKDKYVHHTVAELALGRQLLSTEVVHHVDEDKANNRPSNLVVCPDESYHRLLHARQKILDSGGCPDKDAYCSHHQTVHSKTEFSTKSSRWNGLHNMCRSATNETRRGKGYSKFDYKRKSDQIFRRALKRGIPMSILTQGESVCPSKEGTRP